jgi:hypothetical protein
MAACLFLCLFPLNPLQKKKQKNTRSSAHKGKRNKYSLEVECVTDVPIDCILNRLKKRILNVWSLAAKKMGGAKLGNCAAGNMKCMALCVCVA